MKHNTDPNEKKSRPGVSKRRSIDCSDFLLFRTKSDQICLFSIDPTKKSWRFEWDFGGNGGVRAESFEMGVFYTDEGKIWSQKKGF
ncbi:hypothetical protein AAC387_Pa07g2623 [Persea americana]